MFHSIRWRIAILYAVLILVTMLGLGIYLSNFLRQTYMDDLKSKQSTEARMVGEIIKPLLEVRCIPIPIRLIWLRKSGLKSWRRG